MAGGEFIARDACPKCGSRCIARKKDTENGRPRVHPEPYTCKSCNEHFDTPEEIEVLVPEGG